MRQPGDRLFEHTVRTPRRTKSFRATGGAAFALLMLWITFCLALPIATLVIVLHFILKYW